MNAEPERGRAIVRSLPFRLGVIVFALWLCWVSVTVSVPAALRTANSALALAVAPNDARTLAREAKTISEARPDRAGLTEAGALALRAIARDPTLAPALGIAGFASDARGDGKRAQALFLTSERLSRRDLPTQLWLIEHAVRRDDIAGALQHYDTALRTSKLAPPVLHPVLIGATDDPALLRPMAKVLAQRPAWAHPFLAEALVKGPSSDNLVGLAGELRRAGAPLVDGLEQILLKRLVDEQRFDLATRYYAQAGRARLNANGDGVNDPRFTGRGDFYPFGWELVDTPDLYARVEPAGAGSGGLVFHADTGRAGEAARQLLTLAPGSYELRTRSTGRTLGPLDRPIWTIACSAGKALARADLLTGAPVALRFRVPAGCAAQSLALTIRSVDDPDGVSGAVQLISIRKLDVGG